ncbi:ComEA family DNA-binding protein [Flammeovirga sp. OC4]|uniref:ComEA family DNA-binding protein n=1 Tax=Flammeovirga sp. OC4 TaxID=1382345 RepID=UPI0005C742FE|nr:helix-hairpin-helix domain-containing protein [Flammeovirga sp. OC4]
MKSQWLKDLSHQFSSNRREIASLLILIPFVFIVLYSHQIYSYLFPGDAEVASHKIEVHFLDKEHEKNDFSLLGQVNPNHLKVKDWMKLHFSEEIANRIVNYRLKGGHFYSKYDLYAIYNIDKSKVDELLPYLIFPKKKVYEKKFSNVSSSTSFATMRKKKSKALALQKFDPNTVEEHSLIAMNLSPYFIKSLINYRAKGGKFYKAEDVSKLYGVDSSLYYVIKDYISIENIEQKAVVVEKLLRINLNTASLDQLKQLKGIGNVKAQKILEHKKRLGGSFYQKEQLKEVYGIDSLLFESVSSQVFVVPEDLKKIPINTATYEQLATHPYLSYKQARWIIKYREQHGKYEDIEDLLKIKMIKLKDIENILPYLSFR